MTQNRARILLLLLVALVVVAHLGGLLDFLSPKTVISQSQSLRSAAGAHPVAAMGLFTLAYILVAVLALPAAAALSLVGGYLFGLWVGGLLVLVSATLGAFILFTIARSAIGEPLRKRAGPIYDKIAVEMRRDAFSYLLFLRLIPLFPFFLVNLAAALFEIKPATFLVATFVGMAPATFIYVNLGREISRIESLGDLLSPGTLIALSALGLLALVPVAYRRVRKKPEYSS
jgi:uncharacterized membrane protein YdjX (TVP38/TMEM64 family)